MLYLCFGYFDFEDLGNWAAWIISRTVSISTRGKLSTHEEFHVGRSLGWDGFLVREQSCHLDNETLASTCGILRLMPETLRSWSFYSRRPESSGYIRSEITGLSKRNFERVMVSTLLFDGLAGRVNTSTWNWLYSPRREFILKSVLIFVSLSSFLIQRKLILYARSPTSPGLTKKMNSSGVFTALWLLVRKKDWIAISFCVFDARRG
jgi:hypothetical protein